MKLLAHRAKGLLLLYRNFNPQQNDAQMMEDQEQFEDMAQDHTVDMPMQDLSDSVDGSEVPAE